MKNSFVFYRSWIDAYNKLSCDERERFINNFKHYIDGRLDLIETPSLHEELLWSQVEPLLKTNGVRWDQRCETSKINGKKGGRPKNNNLNNLKKPKYPNNLNNPDDVDVDDDVDEDGEYDGEYEG